MTTLSRVLYVYDRAKFIGFELPVDLFEEGSVGWQLRRRIASWHTIVFDQRDKVEIATADLWKVIGESEDFAFLSGEIRKFDKFVRPIGLSAEQFQAISQWIDGMELASRAWQDVSVGADGVWFGDVLNVRTWIEDNLDSEIDRSQAQLWLAISLIKWMMVGFGLIDGVIDPWFIVSAGRLSCALCAVYDWDWCVSECTLCPLYAVTGALYCDFEQMSVVQAYLQVESKHSESDLIDMNFGMFLEDLAELVWFGFSVREQLEKAAEFLIAKEAMNNES